MTIRVPSLVLGAIVFVLATAAISFGVAFAVNEWRGSDYIDCITKAEAKALDAAERHLADRPVAPLIPGSGASAAAFDTYNQQFRQYETQFENWVKRSAEMDKEWVADMRACA